MVFFDVATGRPSEVATNLRRRVSSYTRRNGIRSFKIGMTNNPVARFLNGYARDYDEMIVLYTSSSHNSVSQMECDLIEHNGALAANQIGGRGGNHGDGPYYLYIVRRW